MPQSEAGVHAERQRHFCHFCHPPHGGTGSPPGPTRNLLPPPRIACYHAYAMASGGQLTYAPLFMGDMLVLRKRIETNKKEELDVVKFSNVRRINKKKRVILHFSAVLFLFA